MQQGLLDTFPSQTLIQYLPQRPTTEWCQYQEVSAGYAPDGGGQHALGERAQARFSHCALGEN